MNQRRIGVYGGTFDPVHRGHLSVARAVWENFALDELLFVPAFVPPHKRGREISSSHHRYAMLALATRHEPQMRISTIELDAPARPYTVETMASLQMLNADAALFFVMGMDSFREVTMWRAYETLLATYGIIVASRPGHTNDDEAKGKHLSSSLQSRVVDLRGSKRPGHEQLVAPHIFVTDYVAVDVSATAVRTAVRAAVNAEGGSAAEAGQSIESLVPSVVADYVRKYALYRD